MKDSSFPKAAPEIALLTYNMANKIITDRDIKAIGKPTADVLIIATQEETGDQTQTLVEKLIAEYPDYEINHSASFKASTAKSPIKALSPGQVGAFILKKKGSGFIVSTTEAGRYQERNGEAKYYANKGGIVLQTTIKHAGEEHPHVINSICVHSDSKDDEAKRRIAEKLMSINDATPVRPDATFFVGDLNDRWPTEGKGATAHYDSIQGLQRASSTDTPDTASYAGKKVPVTDNNFDTLATRVDGNREVGGTGAPYQQGGPLDTTRFRGYGIEVSETIVRNTVTGDHKPVLATVSGLSKPVSDFERLQRETATLPNCSSFQRDILQMTEADESTVKDIRTESLAISCIEQGAESLKLRKETEAYGIVSGLVNTLKNEFRTFLSGIDHYKSSAEQAASKALADNPALKKHRHCNILSRIWNFISGRKTKTVQRIHSMSPSFFSESSRGLRRTQSAPPSFLGGGSTLSQKANSSPESHSAPASFANTKAQEQQPIAAPAA